MSTARRSLIWTVLFCLIAVIWAYPRSRSLDLPSWHEFDDAAVARNFVREPSNFLYPRIDWRRNGPGYAEMEFPLYPWLISRAYLAAGTHIEIGRYFSLAATLLSLVIFALLANSLLPQWGAWAAVLFFGLNRIVTFVATALQPEAFMLLFYLLAMYAFLRWQRGHGVLAYCVAALSLSLAILEKATAAHLGLCFLLLMILEEGWRALRSPLNWLLGILALTPPILWYAHAKTLWTTYGNSLGISNENHWIGLDMLRSFQRPIGLVALEVLLVLGIGGVVLTALGALQWRTRAVKIALTWWLSIFVYYLITIRTTGASWAWYYHVVSVPPAAILFGAGIVRFRQFVPDRRSALAGSLVGLGLMYSVLELAGHLRRFPAAALGADALLAPVPLVELAAAAVLALALVFILSGTWSETTSGAGTQSGSGALTAVLAAAICIYFFTSGHMIAADFARYRIPSPESECARTWMGLVPAGTLIVASGGVCADYSGHKAAYDAPHMFYWLDRKGFSICVEEQSIGKLEQFSLLGARFFVAEKGAVSQRSGLEEQLKKRFRVVAECPSAWLFLLEPANQEF